VGVVHQAIEDGIGQRWVADDFIPTLDRHLAGDDQRTGLVAVCGPAYLGVGQVRRAQHADEDLCHPDLARQRIDDRYLFAGVIYKRLVPGGMGLAHRRRQATLAIQRRPAVPILTGILQRSRPDALRIFWDVEAPATLSEMRDDRTIAAEIIARPGPAHLCGGDPAISA
jgi:hypothetical protein